jgi:hypothetical protein
MDDDNNSSIEKIIEILRPIRTGAPVYKSEEERLAKTLYNAIYGSRVERVKEMLDKGADPNYCYGEAGWVDSNPLTVVAEGFYSIYYARQFEEITDPAKDVLIFNLLIEAGADINRRPYVWDRVFRYNNQDIDTTIKNHHINAESSDLESMKEETEQFIFDANRIIEVFLRAGADPDKLGHPYPFSREAVFAQITDKEAKEYFAQGSRAINVAIEKGIMWESQVDLLLRYTNLDEESLKAAKRSNDPKMIEKIQELWNKQ